MYLIQTTAIKFESNLQQVCGACKLLQISPPINKMGKETYPGKYHRKGKYPFKWGNIMGKEKIQWERENIVSKGKYYRKGKGKFLGKMEITQNRENTMGKGKIP